MTSLSSLNNTMKKEPMYKPITAEQVPAEMLQYEVIRLVWYVTDDDYYPLPE